MADATVQNVLDDARSHLGDDQVSGGEVYTNTVLLAAAFPRAYRTLWRALSSVGAPRVRREAFHVVPANTDVLYPVSASINDMAEPVYVGERGGLTQTAVTTASGTVNVSLTVPSHGRATGDLATVNGIAGLTGTEGMWGLTVADGDVVLLNGAIGSGSYSGGGVLVYSGEDFTEVFPKYRFEDLQSSSNAGVFGNYVWREGAFHFPACSTARQLRIEYWASGTAPTSTTANVGIDDGRDLVALMTAAFGIGSRGGQARRNELLEEAFGPTRQPDGSGGLLHLFINERVKQMQRLDPEERRRQPFRDPAGHNLIIF